ncbi:hypothetical protein [Microbulbifer hainanensis]|uniref:hypothetical protein n=1 Tax=Microbulbifer hainanensis TaxID=2735675 RepID=UPI0018689057|nr:hypothetical protein [Microbulbifer hainanensis]
MTVMNGGLSRIDSLAALQPWVVFRRFYSLLHPSVFWVLRPMTISKDQHQYMAESIDDTSIRNGVFAGP